MQQNRLVVSEQFYSLQGEGPSVGRPAVFLRLAGCNLLCPGFSYVDPISGQHLGCDTKLVWQKGAPISIDQLLIEWEKSGWLHYLLTGAHLVITGGEPLLQQIKIESLIKALDALIPLLYIEIETNGTVSPNEFLFQRINQFNVSPKLSSSLESRAAAYHEKTLSDFVKCPQAIFKFVIQSSVDVDELIKDYQKKFNISPSRIWLMPEGGSLVSMQPKMRMVAEFCKAHGFNFSPRLHIHIWDEATGV